MNWREFFYIRKSDRQVMLILLVLIVVAIAVFHFAGQDAPASKSSYSQSSRQKGNRQASSSVQYYQQPEQAVERFAFDPNTADSNQLLRLGLQPWQVRNIYKYRAKGGVYRQKEDFARLYGLTVKQYRELEPYIQISPDYQPAATLFPDKRTDFVEAAPHDSMRHQYPVKINSGEHVDLNSMDTTVYRTVPGIGSYYARKIVDYGNRLGGYTNIDQLDEIEDFPQDAKSFFTLSNTSNVQKISINKLSLNQLKHHPYINYYQAKAIVDYRRLHGPIHDLQELHLIKDFPPAAIERLRPYVVYEE